MDFIKESEALLKDTSVDQAVLYFVRKLVDKHTFEKYEESLKGAKEVQHLTEFIRFLETRCNILDNVKQQHGQISQPRMKGKNENYLEKCSCCQEKHIIYNCSKFKGMTVNERKEFVKAKRLCLLCLKPNHMVVNCNYKKGCPECNGKHNGILHFKEQEKKTYEKKFDKHTDKKRAFVAVAEDEANVMIRWVYYLQ